MESCRFRDIEIYEYIWIYKDIEIYKYIWIYKDIDIYNCTWTLQCKAEGEGCE